MARSTVLPILAGCAWADAASLALPAHAEPGHRDRVDSLLRDLQDLQDLRRRYPDHEVAMLSPTAPRPASHGYYLSCPRRRECKCKDLSCGTCHNNLPCVDILRPAPADGNGSTSCCCVRPTGYFCNLFTTPEDGKCGSVCCRESTPAGARATLCGANRDAVCCSPYLGQQYDCGYPLDQGVMARGGCCVKKGSSLDDMTRLKCCEHGVGWDCQAAKQGVNQTCCLAHKHRLPGSQTTNRKQPFERGEVCQPPVLKAPDDWRLACENYTTLTATLPVYQQDPEGWMSRVGRYVVPVAACSGVVVLLIIAVGTWYGTIKRPPATQVVIDLPMVSRGKCTVYYFTVDRNTQGFKSSDADAASKAIPGSVTLETYGEALEDAEKYSEYGVEGAYKGSLLVLGRKAHFEEVGQTPPEYKGQEMLIGSDAVRRKMVHDNAIGVDGTSGSVFSTQWRLRVDTETDALAAQFKRKECKKLADRGSRMDAAAGLPYRMAKQSDYGCVTLYISLSGQGAGGGRGLRRVGRCGSAGGCVPRLAQRRKHRESRAADAVQLPRALESE
eukprot:TRINITY_DN6783_c0_g1_i2.p1 TRINITY_DN6783_c0_g1~~TRINITY_DN6783_c0_g1_i2.p1  ORF type:complete len:556 (+),score=83.58 TRINITY_DN6783_c0_g1_i2:90-1757(+)